MSRPQNRVLVFSCPQGITMNRRDFALGLGATALLSPLARAATEPVEGRQYTRVGQPVPVAVAGKIEVIEFFGYWCPHCSQLEPVLEPWVKKLPSDVNFRRIPVAWQAQHVPFQKSLLRTRSHGCGLRGASQGVRRRAWPAPAYRQRRRHRCIRRCDRRRQDAPGRRDEGFHRRVQTQRGQQDVCVVPGQRCADAGHQRPLSHLTRNGRR
ncbi:MAG: hypothetical protein IPG93_25440 [Burkholderiales bacterium]|nr:hypothetical protein [Burkholderiales bacterium]